MTVSRGLLAGLLTALVLAPVAAPPAVAGNVERRGGVSAFVAFQRPDDLSISANGTCLTPLFKFKVVTNATDVVFNGSGKLMLRRKTFGKTAHPRLSVNRWQGIELFKPVCRPGKYRVVVNGRVVDDVTGDTVRRVSDSRTYRVTRD